MQYSWYERKFKPAFGIQQAHCPHYRGWLVPNSSKHFQPEERNFISCDVQIQKSVWALVSLSYFNIIVTKTHLAAWGQYLSCIDGDPYTIFSFFLTFSPEWKRFLFVWKASTCVETFSPQRKLTWCKKPRSRLRRQKDDQLSSIFLKTESHSTRPISIQCPEQRTVCKIFSHHHSPYTGRGCDERPARWERFSPVCIQVET